MSDTIPEFDKNNHDIPSLVDAYAQLTEVKKGVDQHLKDIREVLVALAASPEPGQYEFSSTTHDLVLTIPEKYTWDEDELATMSLRSDAVGAMIGVKHTVKKTEYDKAPEAIKSDLGAALTIEPGSPRATVKEKE